MCAWSAENHGVVQRAAIALFLIAAASGCKRGKGAPNCGDVGAQFLVLAHGEITAATPAPDAATQRALRAQLPAMRDSLVHQCTDAKWSEEVRRCLTDATTAAAFETCQTRLTDDQRRSLGSANSW